MHFTQTLTRSQMSQQHNANDHVRESSRARDTAHDGQRSFASHYQAFHNGNGDFHAARHAAEKHSTAHKHLQDMHIDHNQGEARHSAGTRQDAGKGHDAGTEREGAERRHHAEGHAAREKGWGWDGQKQQDGSTLFNVKGGRVDTDGQGNRIGTTNTSGHFSDGKSLDAKKDAYSVFPASVANKMGLHLGDAVTVSDPKTGKSVNTVYGDTGPENERKFGEFSTKTLKDLGFSHVNGNNGLPNDYHLQMTAYPGTGDGSVDLARNPAALAKAIEDFKSKHQQQ
jgi:hypothetical protein